MSEAAFAKIRIGLELCGIAVFVWASIDYNRFSKFWMLRPAFYTQRARIIFRLFFLACVVGGAWELADTMAASGRPAWLYLSALPVAAAWFVVFFLMLHFVEWLKRKWRISMFERYTEIARRVIVSSKHKASYFGNPDVVTDHLLLGLLSTDKGLAKRFLGSPWAAEAVWEKIKQSRPMHEPIQGPVDLPLSSVSKRALAYAAQEADRLSSPKIGTEHLLLGLLREESCFAAVFLYEHGVRLAETREELVRIPHSPATEEFVRERGPLPEGVVDLQTRIGAIIRRMGDAIAQRDFAKAREYAVEERGERQKLRLLYQKHGLPDWLYE
jgi:hypothetical protein